MHVNYRQISASVPQRTKSVSATKSDLLLLSREIVDVECSNRTEEARGLDGINVEFLHVARSNHPAFKCCI